MNSDLKIIKKKYGEKMMKLCRELFSTILLTEGLLSKIMLEHFYPNHNLYDDIVRENAVGDFQTYINSFTKKSKIKRRLIKKSPQELLALAGYDLYECHTVEDVLGFKKYYAKNEELCTFNSAEERLESCFIYFAVKKDVDKIKRSDYPNPIRQDEYGTSVLSIQFTKDKSHTLSIKNRYNHTVKNPDSTFSNNLDNIIGGLTYSFQKYYGLKQENFNCDFDIPNYIKANDGRYYKFNNEIDGVYYCTDNVIIENYAPRLLEKEKYLLFDYFILNLIDKTLVSYGTYVDDYLPKSIGKIAKIEIKKQGDKKAVAITSKKGFTVVIILNKDNNIYSLVDNYNTFVGNEYLVYNDTLEYLEMNNLTSTGCKFLNHNKAMKHLRLPKLKVAGPEFMYYCLSVLTIDFPEAVILKSSFLANNETLREINAPKLKDVENRVLFCNKSLTVANFPKLKNVGNDFLFHNKVLFSLYAPKLNYFNVGLYFLWYNQNRESLIRTLNRYKKQ